MVTNGSRFAGDFARVHVISAAVPVRLPFQIQLARSLRDLNLDAILVLHPNSGPSGYRRFWIKHNWADIARTDPTLGRAFSSREISTSPIAFCSIHDQRVAGA